MNLKYGNRPLWSIIGNELIIVSIIFLFLSLITLNQSGIQYLFIVLMLISSLLSVYFYRLHRQIYLNIKHNEITILPLFKITPYIIDANHVIRAIKQGHKIVLQFEQEKDISIYLSYLDEADIKKLLLYLKFTPLIKSKFL